MRNRLFFSAVLLLVPLAFFQDTCKRPTPPPPPSPPPVPVPDAGALQARLSVQWEQGPPLSKLKIDYVVENTSTHAVHLGFRDGGRVCGVVVDSQGRQVAAFPEATVQVLGEETFSPGEARLFRYEVRRNQLGDSLSPSYDVEAWLCGYPKLRQRAPVKIVGGK